MVQGIRATAGLPWQPPAEYVGRVRRFYQRAAERYRQPDGSMWGILADAHRTDIHAALTDGADSDVARILGDPASHDLYHGMDPLAKSSIELLSGSGHEQASLADLIAATLAALGDTVGAPRAWNPEIGARPPASVDEMLMRLDAALGVTLQIPNPFPNEFGLASSRGVVGHRVAFAIHQAWVIRNLARLVGKSRLLEIGGGLGRTAFYARQLGLRNYTIVDLPLSCVAQASFLGATLGPGRVWFDGGPPRRGAVRLVPPDWIQRTSERYGVILNCDSLTEMPVEQARAYAQFAAARAHVVFSFNHEGNLFRAVDVFQDLHPGYQRAMSRVRAGYVEEWFFFNLPRWKTAKPPKRAPLWRRVLGLSAAK